MTEGDVEILIKELDKKVGVLVDVDRIGGIILRDWQLDVMRKKS